MFRSPPNLRSGTKGKPVALSSSDKRRQQTVQRSLSASSAISPPATTTMPEVNSEIDPAVIKSAIVSHLTSEDVLSELITRLTKEIKSIVEAVVSAVIKPLNDEVSMLKNDVIALRTKLRELDNCTLERTDDLEQYQRRNNLRIFGIKETTNEDTDALVEKLCREKLDIELPPGAICRSHRVGKQPPPADHGRARYRPIIVRFVGYRHRERVFAAKKMLKGSGVTVREDLTARRMEVYKAAVARHGPRNTWTLDGRVLWIDSNGKKGVATRMLDLGGT